jgi:hypothetical protein
VICQPAYWLAMQAATGSSVETQTHGPGQTRSPSDLIDTRPSPERQISAIASPADRPPAAFTPQSMTRVPQGSGTTSTSESPAP